MKVFSFRAECPGDIAQFRELIQQKALVLNLRQKLLSFGEVAVELETMHSLEELRDVMRARNDFHVMLQTLRELPLVENKLDRDPSVS